MIRSARIFIMIALMLIGFWCLPATSQSAQRVTHFGAVPDDGKDDTLAIQRAVDASPKASTLHFPPGVYHLERTVLFRSQRTYDGAGAATLQFTLPRETYGIALEPNASNLTISGLKLVGGGIRLSDGSLYQNIRIVGNDISQCAPETRGVYVPVANVGLVVEANHFHDFPEWGAIIYHMDKGSLSRNTFSNIAQGAQIVNPYDEVEASFNRGSNLHRMGIEIQQFTANERPCKDLVVEGNVFDRFSRPFYDTFGLSIMPQNGFNVRIVNNHLVAAHDGEWGPPDGKGVRRFGYGIEAGFRTGVVEGNIVAGPWANHIVVSMPNTLVRNNRLFGKPVWRRYITGEPGLKGTGSAIERNNAIESDMTRLPPPPSTQPAKTAD